MDDGSFKNNQRDQCWRCRRVVRGDSVVYDDCRDFSTDTGVRKFPLRDNFRIRQALTASSWSASLFMRRLRDKFRTFTPTNSSSEDQQWHTSQVRIKSEKHCKFAKKDITKSHGRYSYHELSINKAHFHHHL